jgi:predicted transcriptional regulator
MSVNIDAKNMVSIIRWGIMSAVGTFNGNANNEGSRTVNVGIIRTMFKLLGLSSDCKAMRGVKMTHLMYKANLSYSTLHRYLNIALKQDLIKKVCNDDSSVVYCTTEKGKLLLEKLKDVKYALQL